MVEKPIPNSEYSIHEKICILSIFLHLYYSCWVFAFANFINAIILTAVLSLLVTLVSILHAYAVRLPPLKKGENTKNHFGKRLNVVFQCQR